VKAILREPVGFLYKAIHLVRVGLRFRILTMIRSSFRMSVGWFLRLLARAGIHIGWEQLQQVIDPKARLRAKLKRYKFNMRYGAAIRKVRAEKGLSMNAIPDLSSKQLRRIESGASRLTSSAAEKLEKAHGMTPNEYLQAVAEALK